MHGSVGLAMAAMAGLVTPACAQETREGADRTEAQVAPAPQPTETGMNEPHDGGEIANLPYARGKTFRTLDAYLAHLERQGAIDLPYWRQVEPGVYEWVTTRVPRGEPERATRAELMRRYGFTR